MLSRLRQIRARRATHESRLAALEAQLAAKPWKRNILIPSPSVQTLRADSDFMSYSSCSARDFLHPRYSELSLALNIPISYHRKYWEWVFILHTALGRGLARPGERALGFAVGTEPLAAALARHGVSVTATDAP